MITEVQLIAPLAYEKRCTKRPTLTFCLLDTELPDFLGRVERAEGGAYQVAYCCGEKLFEQRK